MKKSFGVLFVVGAYLLIFAGACSKKQTVEVDNETQSTVDNAIVDQEFMVIAPSIRTCYEQYYGHFSYELYTSYCGNFVKQGGDTLYGTAGHVDPVYTMTIGDCTMATIGSGGAGDGRIRAGSISARFTGPLRNGSSQMIIKLQDYRADGISFSCDSLIATVISYNGALSTFNVRLVNGLCKATSYAIKYNFDRTIICNPYNTSNVDILAYGTSSGVTRENKIFSVTVPQQTPLIRNRNCKFITEGALQITPEGFKTRTVDFGNGNCDDDATFSVNGNTLAFKLK